MDAVTNLISEAEITFTTGGISENFRNDGRSCFDHREFTIQTGVISSCNGSSRIECANCDIIVGIKLELSAPNEDEPDLGRIEFSADLSANASPQFAGRGGDEIAQEIVCLISNAISASIDRKVLCVTPGETVWIIFVDILILECGPIANLIDASSMAIKAALYDTRIPCLIVDEEDPKEFVITEDPVRYTTIDIKHIPLLLTLTRIHDKYIVDATQDEEAAGIARVTLAIDGTGEISYVKKSGSGSLHPYPLKDILHKASKMAIDMHQVLYKKMNIAF